jgi:hypothetical protein
MNRHILTAAAGLVLVIVLALNTSDDTGSPGSNSVRVTGDNITTLLAGQTAIGIWGDDTYRQYFDPSGTTFYAPKGKRTTRGKWRVSDDGLSYESWWSGDDDNWEVYGVFRDANGLVWIDPDGVRYPFEVVEGQQLVWPE